MPHRRFKFRRLTVYDEPETIVDSGWGRIDWRTWCRLESMRLIEKHMQAEIRPNGGSRIAVFCR